MLSLSNDQFVALVCDVILIAVGVTYLKKYINDNGRIIESGID
jgi:hypothetical protein